MKTITLPVKVSTDSRLRVNLTHDGYFPHIAVFSDGHRETADLVAKAVNEHAALVAVAEAAADALNVLQSLDLRPAHDCTANELNSALANLAAVREGGAK